MPANNKLPLVVVGTGRKGPSRCGAQEEGREGGERILPVYYLPKRVLLACLPASAFAVYLALRDSALSRRALFALTAVLARLLLLGAAVAALAVSV